jgi:hypothetical protein
MALANVPPWTIKGVDPRIRERGLRYAKIDGTPMGEWLGRAIENHANMQDRNQVLPPDQPVRPEPKTDRPGPFATSAPSLDYLGDVAAALQALAAAAGAGLPVSKGAVRDMVRLMQVQARAARGLPDSRTRRSFGQTTAIEHGAADVGPGEAGRTADPVEISQPNESTEEG